MATAAVKASGDRELAWNIATGSNAEMHNAHRARGARRIAAHTTTRKNNSSMSRPAYDSTSTDASNGRRTAKAAAPSAYGAGEYHA